MKNRSIHLAAPALAAALLFGASVPMAKWLLGDLSPLLLAGLLYLGSGLGLGFVTLLRAALGGGSIQAMHIPRADWPWLLGATLFGGVLGSSLLMLGLTRTDGATASLLLKVEGVLTAVLAWLVFRENADHRIVLGMMAIIAGGLLLSWQAGGLALSGGALFILGACLAWAIDNNLTRKGASHDAHHQHDHDFPWDGVEPHVHAHRHEAMTHRHAHYPDIHHRHDHAR